MKTFLKINNIYFIVLIIFLLFLTSAVFTNPVSAETHYLSFSFDRLPEREYNLSTNNHVFRLPKFHVRGIYVSAWVAGTESKLQKLIELTNNTVINTMVIDVKDQLGYVSYPSKVGLVQQLNANRNKIRDIKGLLSRLHREGIYTIARIAVFKDGILAKARQDLALQLWDLNNSKLIYSPNWVNPAKDEVWDYNVRLAREAIELGFDEVQFDYIRFPALANKPLQVVLQKNQTKSNLINSFAAFARDRLKDLKVPLSIDVFGLTTTVKDDLGIGQNFKQLASIVNIMSPMVYPSHYAAGSYGIKNPSSQPYKIIYHSMSDARKKVGQKPGISIRPWLQDFSLGYKYTDKDVQEQIRAVEALQLKEWLLWNPRSEYTTKAILKNPPR